MSLDNPSQKYTQSAKIPPYQEYHLPTILAAIPLRALNLTLVGCSPGRIKMFPSKGIVAPFGRKIKAFRTSLKILRIKSPRKD
jgi:hypothetical protein